MSTEQTAEQNRFAAAIGRSGVTNKWLAGELGIYASEVSRYRNGLRPSPKRQSQIAEALSRRLDDPVTAEELWPTT